MEGFTVDGHHPECRVTCGRGDLILFDKIPAPTIELPQRRTFLYISLPEKLIGKSHRPLNKTFIRGAALAYRISCEIKRHRRAKMGCLFSGTEGL